MINTKEVGVRIAECRKAQHITQTDLAAKLQVSSKTISKWEKGHGLPNIEILPELSACFGVSIDYLLMGTAQIANSKPQIRDVTVERVLTLEKVSYASLQRVLCIGFSKAANILDQLIANNLVDQSHNWIIKDKDVVKKIISNFI